MISSKNGEMQSSNNPDSVSEAEDLFAIWYDDAGSSLEEDIRIKISNYLNDIFDCVLIRNHTLGFFKLLRRLPNETGIFLIITSRRARRIHSYAERHLRCKQIYMFPWTIPTDKHFPTITNVDELFKNISSEKNIYQRQWQASTVSESVTSCHRMSNDMPLWNICDLKLTESCCQYWRKRSSHFFLSQALNRVLTRMKCRYWPAFQEMIEACRSFCVDRQVPLQNSDKMEIDYPSKGAVWYYTGASSVFRALGQAFRLQHFDKIYKFRRFIIDLHTQIVDLAQKNNNVAEKRLFYRGKKMHLFQIQQLKDYIGCLISWNGFLSTTRKFKVACEVFGGIETNRPDFETVIFEFHVDEITTDRYYADVSSRSQFYEELEVLFTIGSLWRIVAVHPSVYDRHPYWTIKLTRYRESDSRLLRPLTDVTDATALHMIGDILRDLGRHEEAENFYHRMLREKEMNEEVRATLLNNIAMINMAQRKHHEAIRYFRKAKNLLKTKMIETDALAPLPLYSASNTASLIHLFNNMALSYQAMDNFQQADKCYRQALQSENASSADKATVNGNLAGFCVRNKRYVEAMKHIEMAVKLAEDHSLLNRFKRERNYIKECLKSCAELPVEEYAWF